MTSYPNREHKNENESALLRAIGNLNAIAEEVRTLKLKLEGDYGRSVFADDAQVITTKARELTRDLTMLEVLRNVREWHAADALEAGKAVTA